LDGPFRKAGPGICLVRYVDDLLVACPSGDVDREVDAVLRRMLTPEGMALKAVFGGASKDLRIEPVE